MPAKPRCQPWRVVLALVATLSLSGCVQPGTDRAWVVEGRQGMVASDSAAASRVGAAVLRGGGNAIDAAVATSFALAVARPQSTGLGGGGFLLYRRAEDGAIFALDFRECAPAAADAGMFVRARRHGNMNAPAPSRFGHLAAAVPGLVAGMTEAHQRWGTKPLSELLYGAILLARDGFAADEAYVKACREVPAHYERYPSLENTCGYVWRTHLRSGRPPAVGDIVKSPALARLLERISAEGRGGFYGGSVARDFEGAMAEHGGLITGRDLSQYRVKEREPIRIKYRGYEIVSMPPPSSGGICLAEIMNILERFDLAEVRDENPPAATHLMAEAFKHAFADRANWLGDTDFVRVPVDWLASPEYAGSIAARISMDRTSAARDYGLAPPPTDGGTSHFCIVDPEGNCVVATETINTEFGSLAAVERWGLILNNEMDDFAAEPGKPNAYGLTQSRRNAVQPGKRPLSSMSPTIVLKDGKPVLLLGGSGGPRIISSVANVMVNVLDYGMELGDAMEAIRLHHQWLPDKVYFDRAPPKELLRGLHRRGHSVSVVRKTGIVQAILLRDGKLIGASDPRKGGRPAGW